MPYINNDGTVGGKKPFLRLIRDFFVGIIDFVALFFGALTNPPQRIESRATFNQRNNGRSYTSSSSRPSRGSNIRGVKNLGGNCEARMGG